VGRWTGSWLSGPASAAVGSLKAADRHPGERLGLPRTGPGSAVGFGRRLAGFLVDSVIANLLVGLVYLGGLHPGPGLRGELVVAGFLLQELVLISAAGATIGMRMAGVRVVRAADGGPPGVAMVALRTALLALLVPAVIWDSDGRGMHDRASGTIVVRA